MCSKKHQTTHDKHDFLICLMFSLDLKRERSDYQNIVEDPFPNFFVLL